MENIILLHLKLKLKISEHHDSAVRSFYWASNPLKSWLLLHSSLLLFVLKVAISSNSTLLSPNLFYFVGMEADEKLYNKLVDGYRMEQPQYATKEV